MRSRSRNDRGADRSLYSPFLAKFNGHFHILYFYLNGLTKWHEMGRKRAISAGFLLISGRFWKVLASFQMFCDALEIAGESQRWGVETPL